MNFNSFACGKYKAQFVGLTYTVDSISEKGCELAIDFDLYTRNALCPLLKEQAIQKKIIADAITCKLVNNTNTSGTLSLDLKTDIITFEL